MFERFSADARAVVVAAQDEARGLRHPFIGTEHLLLAMADGQGPGGKLLTERGITAQALRGRLRALDGSTTDLDATALSTLGIDLEQVRRAAEEQFGPGALTRNAKPMPRGHLPFTKRSKKVLELAVRDSQAMGADSIGSAHLLLGLIAEDGGLGVRLLRDSGVDLAELAAQARAIAGHRAA